MIVGFRDRWLQEFFLLDQRSKHVPSELATRLFRKLQLLDDSSVDADLRVPVSNHFEKLRGNLEGWHSIRVNERWRLIFRWEGGRGEAADVYLDNHDYR
jgi:toxin HigB-1